MLGSAVAGGEQPSSSLVLQMPWTFGPSTAWPSARILVLGILLLF